MSDEADVVDLTDDSIHPVIDKSANALPPLPPPPSVDEQAISQVIDEVAPDLSHLPPVPPAPLAPPPPLSGPPTPPLSPPDDLWRSASPADPPEEEDSVRVPASLYRDQPEIQEPQPGIVEVEQPVTQPTDTVIMPVEPTVDDRRAARSRALGEVEPGADVVAAPPKFGPPSVYKPWPSFVLFVFRLLVAAALSIRATQELGHLSATKALWANSVLSSPDLLAVLQIVLEYLIAIMLILGLGTRVAGILMVVVFTAILAFLVWGPGIPVFTSGVNGFLGEYELGMVAIGLLFAGIGGGRAAVDGAVHRARLEKKNARLGQ
ncbi:MAG: DoxX family protein [Propionibacteriaceae bacterium]|nr:DoxX family protein [Propionibacteriaceae bacterium]